MVCLASLRGPKVSLRDSDLDKLKASIHLHGTKATMTYGDDLLFIEIQHKKENWYLYIHMSGACLLYSQTKYWGGGYFLPSSASIRVHRPPSESWF